MDPMPFLGCNGFDLLIGVGLVAWFVLFLQEATDR